MSSYSEIMIRVDECVPNALPERVKLSWLTSLDGMLAVDVLGMDIREVRAMPHKYPDAMECEPLIGYPYEEIYDHWLMARIHKANGEDDKYQNVMMLYNEALSTFQMWFLNTYRHGKPVPTWFITAYGIAVKQGFVGSIDEWLASLRGEKGDPGKSAYESALQGGYTGTELEFYSDLLGRGKTAYQYAVEGGYAGSEGDFRIKMAMEYAAKDHDHTGTYAAKDHGHGKTYAPFSHNHSADDVNEGVLSADRIPVVPIKKGGTGGEDRKGGFANLAYIGKNPVTVATDTPAAWAALGDGFAGINAMCTNGQLSPYGAIINLVVDNNNVHQLFIAVGKLLAMRGGTVSGGWTTPWSAVYFNTGGTISDTMTLKGPLVLTRGVHYGTEAERPAGVEGQVYLRIPG